ncbi:unnamed protein product [Caenorhabditis auriculariae]|uniref:Uncharacterized protein n=1 Tax=Caenorhabditis auriculariae TaxID=2777116 RepID=A0A8S1HBY8_9PELO|nr:unnamed protein product [Caenorhabditis auriculariae]
MLSAAVFFGLIAWTTVTATVTPVILSKHDLVISRNSRGQLYKILEMSHQQRSVVKDPELESMLPSATIEFFGKTPTDGKSGAQLMDIAQAVKRAQAKWNNRNLK